MSCEFNIVSFRNGTVFLRHVTPPLTPRPSLLPDFFFSTCSLACLRGLGFSLLSSQLHHQVPVRLALCLHAGLPFCYFPRCAMLLSSVTFPSVSVFVKFPLEGALLLALPLFFLLLSRKFWSFFFADNILLSRKSTFTRNMCLTMQHHPIGKTNSL